MRALIFPFRLNNAGQISMTTSYPQIVRGQVIDAVMTNLGERVYRPRYGCDIQAALFDPVDELVRRDAASQIKLRLSALVTRAIVRRVTVEEGAPGTVIITIVYRPALYATDTELAIPVASEFLTRQRSLSMGAIDA
jgi:phage baseplate assembly protein W